jgi:hypothetical protein
MLLALLLAAASPSEPASEPAATAAEEPAERESSEGPKPGAGKRERANYFRLVDHIKYENCVRTNALAIARLDAGPETLARAAVAFCHQEEVKLYVSAIIECRDTGETENRGGVCADKRMARWRDIAEREAFGCIAGTRFKPAAVGVSICKLSDPSSARSLSHS